jgi:hypothetical protein
MARGRPLRLLALAAAALAALLAAPARAGYARNALGGALADVIEVKTRALEAKVAAKAQAAPVVVQALPLPLPGAEPRLSLPRRRLPSPPPSGSTWVKF